MFNVQLTRKADKLMFIFVIQSKKNTLKKNI